MKIKHFYYCVFYLLHIRALRKLSSMEASQQSRSRSIYSIKTGLTPSWRVSLIMITPSKFITQGRSVIMKVSRVTQNIRIWRATIVTKKGTLDLSVGFERRNNQMLMSLNLLKEMKNSATFYLLQIDQLVIKINGNRFWMFAAYQFQ